MNSLLVWVASIGLFWAQSAGAASAPWNGRIYDVRSKQFLSEAQARQVLSGVEILVLGEKHDTATVQKQQSVALTWAAEAQKLGPSESWILGWEFLNRKDQALIDPLWDQFRAGTLSGAGGGQLPHGLL